MYVLAQISKKFHWKLTTEDCLGIIFLLSLFYRTSIIENVAFQLSYGLTAIFIIDELFCRTASSRKMEENNLYCIFNAYHCLAIDLSLFFHVEYAKYFVSWFSSFTV